VNKKIVNNVRRGFYGYDWREIRKDPTWEPDESKAVSMPCRAGQFLIFPTTLMHASTPHTKKTKEMRLAFAARYVPTSVKIYGERSSVTELGGSFSLENYGAVLVSGKNTYTQNRIRTHTTKGKAFINCDPK
jgi:non-heme Fe2+,alpha-ketoglutarate-dependent halogenase